MNEDNEIIQMLGLLHIAYTISNLQNYNLPPNPSKQVPILRQSVPVSDNCNQTGARCLGGGRPVVLPWLRGGWGVEGVCWSSAGNMQMWVCGGK